MQIGALGDIHGAFETVQQIVRRHADVPVWVCVGDVASNDGEYFSPEAPIYFIKGNNEDFDVIAAAIKGHPPAPTLNYLPNGGPHVVGPWRVAALGGTFAPSWYNTPAASLPPSKGRKPTAGTLKLGKARDDNRSGWVDEASEDISGLLLGWAQIRFSMKLPQPLKEKVHIIPARFLSSRRQHLKTELSHSHFKVSSAIGLITILARLMLRRSRTVRLQNIHNALSTSTGKKHPAN